MVVEHFESGAQLVKMLFAQLAKLRRFKNMRVHNLRVPNVRVPALSLVLMTLVLSACSGIDNTHVPVGTWQQTDQQRYMSIEPDGAHYKAVLFSVFDNNNNK